MSFSNPSIVSARKFLVAMNFGTLTSPKNSSVVTDDYTRPASIDTRRKKSII